MLLVPWRRKQLVACLHNALYLDTRILLFSPSVFSPPGSMKGAATDWSGTNSQTDLGAFASPTGRSAFRTTFIVPPPNSQACWSGVVFRIGIFRHQDFEEKKVQVRNQEVLGRGEWKVLLRALGDNMDMWNKGPICIIEAYIPGLTVSHLQRGKK